MTDSPQRFLIVRLSSIGDIVHALPAVAALGETFPQAEIYWAVESRHALLLEGNPYLRGAVKLDTLGWRKRLTAAATWHEIRDGVRALRKVRYDAALDFQGLWKSAVIGWISGAPERIGFADRWLREPGAAVLYTEHVSPRACRHVIEMNLALVGRLGARPSKWQFPLPWNDTDDTYVDNQLAVLDAKDFIIINPGGGWRSKCWSPENYAELLRRLEERCEEQLILTGSVDEEDMISGILAACRCRARALFAHHACAVHRARPARPALPGRGHGTVASGGCGGNSGGRHLWSHGPLAQRPIREG